MGLSQSAAMHLAAVMQRCKFVACVFSLRVSNRQHVFGMCFWHGMCVLLSLLVGACQRCLALFECVVGHRQAVLSMLFHEVGQDSRTVLVVPDWDA